MILVKLGFAVFFNVPKTGVLIARYFSEVHLKYKKNMPLRTQNVILMRIKLIMYFPYVCSYYLQSNWKLFFYITFASLRTDNYLQQFDLAWIFYTVVPSSKNLSEVPST